MVGSSSGTAPPRLERAGLTACTALSLAPLLAQGAWRPLGHALGLSGDAVAVTVGALGVAAIVSVLGGLRRGPAWGPLLVGLLLAGAVTGGAGLGASGFGALGLVALVSAALARWVPGWLPESMDGLMARHRALTAVYLFFALFSLVSLGRLSVYVGDPDRTDLQSVPGDTFIERHSCLTAYVRASELADEGAPNLYDDRWWAGSLGLPPRPEGAEDPFSPFGLDNFSYPPPFLLLVSPLTPFRGDFLAQRALWFGLNGLITALGAGLVARWAAGPRGHRALLLVPILMGSLPVLLTLQIGNFHLAALVLTVLAMVAFERGRDLTGSALLAATILSKISPGVLGVVLLVQRRFKRALLTAGFGALFLAAALLRFGLEPLRSFVGYALPRLSSGAAFPHMSTEGGILTNTSLFGFAFKLQYLGFDVGDPWTVGSVLGRLYTVGVVALAVLGARRGGDRRELALRWMGLMVVAAMQSPFSPAYAALGLVWAATLLAVEVRSGLGALGLVGGLVAMLFQTQLLPPTVRVELGMAQTLLTLGVSSWLILRAPAPAAQPHPASVLPSLGGPRAAR